MSTQNEITIKLAPFFSASHLALRNTADMLFDEIDRFETKNIIIDFSDIHTVSRSFAHQYLLREKKSRKNITKTNMNEDIKEMFKIVASTKIRKIDTDMTNIKVVSLSKSVC